LSAEQCSTTVRVGCTIRVAMLTESDELSGEEVVNGFRCVVGELFSE
jgi:hypothetical protein